MKSARVPHEDTRMPIDPETRSTRGFTLGVNKSRGGNLRYDYTKARRIQRLAIPRAFDELTKGNAHLGWLEYRVSSRRERMANAAL